MVPTLTILGRFSEATRGAVIPWLETTLVTVVIMAVPAPKVTSIPPAFANRFLPNCQPPIRKRVELAINNYLGTFSILIRRDINAGDACKLEVLSQSTPL